MERGFAARNRRDREINRNLRLFRLPFPNERNAGYDFSNRDSVQPDGARFRPSERPGKKAEPLPEVGPIRALRYEPRSEVEDDKGKRCELEKTIEEKMGRDAENSILDSEYSVGWRIHCAICANGGENISP